MCYKKYLLLIYYFKKVCINKNYLRKSIYFCVSFDVDRSKAVKASNSLSLSYKNRNSKLLTKIIELEKIFSKGSSRDRRKSSRY